MTSNFQKPGAEKNKKSVNDGIRDSYLHVSPAGGDNDQGTFFDTPSYRLQRYLLRNKKSVNNGIRDSYFHMSPQGATAINALSLILRHIAFSDISYVIRNLNEKRVKDR